MRRGGATRRLNSTSKGRVPSTPAKTTEPGAGLPRSGIKQRWKVQGLRAVLRLSSRTRRSRNRRTKRILTARRDRKTGGRASPSKLKGPYRTICSRPRGPGNLAVFGGTLAHKDHRHIAAPWRKLVKLMLLSARTLTDRAGRAFGHCPPTWFLGSNSITARLRLCPPPKCGQDIAQVGGGRAKLHRGHRQTQRCARIRPPVPCFLAEELDGFRGPACANRRRSLQTARWISDTGITATRMALEGNQPAAKDAVKLGYAGIGGGGGVSRRQIRSAGSESAVCRQ